MAKRAHLITGGFPAGSHAGHDMDYARLRLLGILAEHDDATTTVANDFSELDKWLDGADLLITYIAGPVPNAEQHEGLRNWLQAGGRWFGLRFHGPGLFRSAKHGFGLAVGTFDHLVDIRFSGVESLSTMLANVSHQFFRHGIRIALLVMKGIAHWCSG